MSRKNSLLLRKTAARTRIDNIVGEMRETDDQFQTSLQAQGFLSTDQKPTNDMLKSVVEKLKDARQQLQILLLEGDEFDFECAVDNFTPYDVLVLVDARSTVLVAPKAERRLDLLESVFKRMSKVSNDSKLANRIASSTRSSQFHISDVHRFTFEPVAKRKSSSITLEFRDGSQCCLYGRKENCSEMVQVLDAHCKRFNGIVENQMAVLKKLHERSRETYCKDNDAHEAQLMRLWEVVFPDKVLDERVSRLWSLLGFQGMDPSTDFRGMGLLGLDTLLYFAETYTEFVRHVCVSQRGYPFASVGINMTSYLLQELQFSSDTPSPARDSKMLTALCCLQMNGQAFPFQEMFCSLMTFVDCLWVSLNAQYMDFPRVMSICQELVHAALTEGNIVSSDDFLFRLKAQWECDGASPHALEIPTSAMEMLSTNAPIIEPPAPSTEFGPP